MQEIFWRTDNADIRIPQTLLCIAARKYSITGHLECVLS
jgi:hypothetical protein